MKIIDAHFEHVAQINCNCMAEEHFIRVLRDKSYKKNDDIYDTVCILKFTNDYDDSFIERLKYFFLVNKEFDNFKTGRKQAWHGMYLSNDQLKELYQVLVDNFTEHDILDKEELEQIESWEPNNLQRFPWSDKETEIDEESLKELIVHKTQDTVVLSVDVFGKDNALTETMLGWTYPEDMPRKELISMTWKYVTRNSKIYSHDYEALFNLKDTIDFLGAINYILRTFTFSN